MHGEGGEQRRCDRRHELLTQHALFCIGVNAKKGMLSQHIVMRVIPPLGGGGGGGGSTPLMPN